MQTSLTNNYIRTPTKSTVILSSNDVIACCVIVDVANFDLRAKNPRSAPEADGMKKQKYKSDVRDETGSRCQLLYYVIFTSS